MEFFKNLFTNDNSIIGLCGFEETRESLVCEIFERQMRQRSHGLANRVCQAGGEELLSDDLTNNLNRIFTDCNYAPPVNLMYKNQQHLKNIFCG